MGRLVDGGVGRFFRPERYQDVETFQLCRTYPMGWDLLDKGTPPSPLQHWANLRIFVIFPSHWKRIL